LKASLPLLIANQKRKEGLLKTLVKAKVRGCFLMESLAATNTTNKSISLKRTLTTSKKFDADAYYAGRSASSTPIDVLLSTYSFLH
jgi:hypothetical protein